MSGSSIPIRNLYYMLCYAWNQLPQGKLVDVSRIPTTELVDLFAFVLCDGIQHLAKRGLGQDYEPHEEEITGVRGRVRILQSARRFLPAHGRALCSFDELTPNTISNKILKSTLRDLELAPNLHGSLRKRVHALRRELKGIDEISLNSQLFRQVQLHSNSRFYKFLLNVCGLVQGSWLVDQEAGRYRFREFVRDEAAMAKVFQDFLFNFIRIEVPNWAIRREHIFWNATSESDPGLLLLPRMETDISLRRGAELKIIDAKYYQRTLVQRFETEKIHSANLYQLFAYLANVVVPDGTTLQGMLIYPRVEKDLRAEYRIHSYGVTVATVDLEQPWESIRQEILGLIG